MKTENILIIAAGLAAGYYVGKKKEGAAVSGIGAKKPKPEVDVNSVIVANFERQMDMVHRQWKHLKSYKTSGSLFVLKKDVEALNFWLDDIKPVSKVSGMTCNATYAL